MDDIQVRLKETSDACLKAYGEWQDKKKDSKAQEELHAAIHELRKVSSRLEIELAMSEREQMTSKPLPIPPHRANARKRHDDDNNNGSSNNQDKGKGNKPTVEKKDIKRRRSAPRKKSGGDGGE